MMTKIITYAEEKEHQENEIKNNWFKNHKPTIRHYLCGVSDGITVLDWQEPGTGIFYVRYVFDRNSMYVSGDLGEAVFRFTEIAIPERIARYNLDYFCEKLGAFCDPERDFSRQKAREYIEERITDYENEKYDKEAYTNLLNIVEDCESIDAYHIALADFDYCRIGNDAWEWISEIGSVIPMRLRSYLIGIQMAVRQ